MTSHKLPSSQLHNCHVNPSKGFTGLHWDCYASYCITVTFIEIPVQFHYIILQALVLAMVPAKDVEGMCVVTEIVAGRWLYLRMPLAVLAALACGRHDRKSSGTNDSRDIRSSALVLCMVTSQHENTVTA